MGKRSSEFTAAAQQKANATWFCLIIAGVVWYFFEWPWALIPAALVVYTAFQSISATMIATRLENHELNSEAHNTRSESYESNHTVTSEEAERITQEFGRFLAERLPIIKDANLLPFPKSIIMKALIMQEQFACDKANELKASGRSEELQEIEKYIGVLGFTRVGLDEYHDIDPEDKPIVSYFNSFSTISDVPEDKTVECVKLIGKYMSNGNTA